MSELTVEPPPLRFGQVVIGPPGSGKTTYCQAMQEFLTNLGRKVVVVNMDPANEGLPYTCAVDISELVTLDDVMDGLKLGPNGGLLYCMEYVEANLDWLEEKLRQHSDSYFLFDCPGQVELYTHQHSVKNVFSQLAKWNFRVSVLNAQRWDESNSIGAQMGTVYIFFCVCLMKAITPHPPPSVADICAPCGLTLLRGPGQVHLCAVHLIVHYAARGASSRQHPVQDGPDRAVRQTR